MLEISYWLLPLDKQILRRINIKFRDLFFYDEILFDETVLELLHLIKYKSLWSNLTTANMARHGNIYCLKYLHENGCFWDRNTSIYAARHGNLHCLKYAYENGCPLDGDTTLEAAWNGNLDCLR